MSEACAPGITFRLMSAVERIPQLVYPHDGSVIGRNAVSRMRWVRGRVSTKSTTSATSSARHHPGEHIRRAAVALLEREVRGDAARTDVGAADAVLAQLVVERAGEADLAELRGAVDGLDRQAAPTRLGGDA